MGDNSSDAAHTNPQAVNPWQIERNKEELRLLDIKSDVMNEEIHEAQRKVSDFEQQEKAKQGSLNMLTSEKEDALERLKKIQREMQLIEDFRQKEEEEMERIRKDKDDATQQVKFIQEALGKIKEDQKRLQISIEVSKYSEKL